MCDHRSWKSERGRVILCSGKKLRSRDGLCQCERLSDRQSLRDARKSRPFGEALGDLFCLRVDQSQCLQICCSQEVGDPLRRCDLIGLREEICYGLGDSLGRRAGEAFSQCLDNVAARNSLRLRSCDNCRNPWVAQFETACRLVGKQGRLSQRSRSTQSQGLGDKTDWKR